MGWPTGLEPATTRTTIWGSTVELRPPLHALYYNVLQHLACPAGLEPTTPSLEGWCSIRLSYGQPPGQTLVGVERFELPTSCSQSKRATRLRYTPKKGGNDTLGTFREQFLCLLQGGIFCYKAAFSFAGDS